MANGCHAAALEAEEVIFKWLKNVESEPCRDINAAGSSYGHIASATSVAEDHDFLKSLDWGNGNVMDTAKGVVEGLMKKTFSNVGHMTELSMSHDPRISMEMRHKQVRERRRLRDQKHYRHMESQLLLKQAQREASMVVLREERETRKKVVLEEKLINQQIALIRGQVRERHRTCCHLAAEQRTVIEIELRKNKERERNCEVCDHEGLSSILTSSPTVLRAEKIIQEERKRQQTRSELVRQFQEAETRELKEEMKLLRCYFSVWYESVVKRRAKVGKAVAVREWRLMARVWSAWRRWLVATRRKMEEEMATREMQRNKRLHQVSSEHYQCRLLQWGMCVWRAAVRQAGARRKEVGEEERRKEKMQSLLKTALKKAEASREVIATPLEPIVTLHSSEDINAIPTSSGVVRQNRKPPVPKTLSSAEPATKQYQVWEEETTTNGAEAGGQWMREPKVRNDITSKKSEIEGLEPDTKGSGDSARLKSSLLRNKMTMKLKNKPVTKPQPLTGMASRAAAMAERKLARVAMRAVILAEQAERQAKEEEQRLKEEQLAKENQLKHRREEKKVAKLKEVEKMKQQQIQTELNLKASNHHHSLLLHHRGLAPWRRFVVMSRENRRAADVLCRQLLQRRVFVRWCAVWREMMAEKEKRAEVLYCKTLIRRTWTAWNLSVVLSHENELLAMKMHPCLLVKTCLLGWKRVTKEEQNEYWEKSARARRYRHKFLLQKTFQVWLTYLPLAREELAKETRRAQLRHKVSSWLSDFHDGMIKDA